MSKKSKSYTVGYMTDDYHWHFITTRDKEYATRLHNKWLPEYMAVSGIPCQGEPLLSRGYCVHRLGVYHGGRY